MPGFVYILSTSYSGSTLLTFLLNAHPTIATIGELKASAMGDIERYECSCGRRLVECPFWQRVGEELRRRGSELDFAHFGTHFRLPARGMTDRLLRARYRGGAAELARSAWLRLVPSARACWSRIIERNKALIDVITQLQSADEFLDGSKDPIRLWYLLRAGFARVRVIHLLRDGRAAAASFCRHEGLSAERAAWEWRSTHEECERLLRRLPCNAWRRLRYENLCADVDGEMASLFTFLDLEPAAACRDFRACEHHIIGNAMRLQSRSDIRVDERWRKDLTREDLATFERVAGPLNRYFGYE